MCCRMLDIEVEQLVDTDSNHAYVIRTGPPQKVHDSTAVQFKRALLQTPGTIGYPSLSLSLAASQGRRVHLLMAIAS